MQRRGSGGRGPWSLPPPTSADRRLELGQLASMCQAIGDMDRLRLFKRIAEAGRNGVDAADIDDEHAVETLVAAGVVTPVILRGALRYRAERRRLVAALDRLRRS